MTLAMLVAVITASSSRKLPKVNCPIESEDERIRASNAAKADGIMINTKLQIAVSVYETTSENIPNRFGASEDIGRSAHRADLEHLAVIAGLEREYEAGGRRSAWS